MEKKVMVEVNLKKKMMRKKRVNFGGALRRKEVEVMVDGDGGEGARRSWGSSPASRWPERRRWWLCLGVGPLQEKKEGKRNGEKRKRKERKRKEKEKEKKKKKG